jgi:hypothetical protein
MSDLLWDTIETEFKHNACADVVRIEIALVNGTYYLLSSADKVPASALIHVDDFAEMFGMDVQRRVNERLKKWEAAHITLAIEAD